MHANQPQCLKKLHFCPTRGPWAAAAVIRCSKCSLTTSTLSCARPTQAILLPTAYKKVESMAVVMSAARSGACTIKWGFTLLFLSRPWHSRFIQTSELVDRHLMSKSDRMQSLPWDRPVDLAPETLKSEDLKV